MNATGKVLTGCCLLVLTLFGQPLLAAVSASLDRTEVAVGDTLRLTITADDGENTDEADLRPLLRDFEILQRSSSSNFSLINGKRSKTKQLHIDMTPKREGILRIPPMRIGKGVTNLLDVQVSAAPDIDAAGQTVIFTAELDQDEVYVQGQVILTLRLQQAINLDNRSISELEIEDAFVKELEQNSFQRTIDGRQWLVHEVRYALFPEHSGELEIPGQTFTARVRMARRSLFDNNRGQLMRRSTEPLSVNVLPRPASFSGNTWLPARQVTLAEQWSTPPEQLKAGESATRTIRIQGEGVQGAQLPPVLFTPVEGLKFYPDQPQINDQEMSTGLMGTRVDSTAILPTREGVFTIPEVRIPWWDSESAQVRYAILPARDITVAAAQASANELTRQSVVTDTDGATLRIAGGSALTWQLLAAFSTLGWLATLAWMWRLQRQRPSGDGNDSAADVHEGRAFKNLLGACADNDAAAARMALISWTASLSGKPEMVSIDQAVQWHEDETLARELAGLDNSLFGKARQQWSGSALADCARTLRKARRGGKNKDKVDLALYPRAA